MKTTTTRRNETTTQRAECSNTRTSKAVPRTRWFANKLQTAVMVGFLLASLTASAQDRQSAPTNKIEPLPRDLEIQLALSALPPRLRDEATVYVLNPARGFEVAREGANKFHAFVARTGDDTFRGSWTLTKYRDDILYPIGFDEAGAKAQMRVFFDAAEMQAQGTPPGELKKIIQERYKAGFYKAPQRPGVAYMLSPILRTYFAPEKGEGVATLNLPHVMYYAPNLSNETFAAGCRAERILLLSLKESTDTLSNRTA